MANQRLRILKDDHLYYPTKLSNSRYRQSTAGGSEHELQTINLILDSLLDTVSLSQIPKEVVALWSMQMTQRNLLIASGDPRNFSVP